MVKRFKLGFNFLPIQIYGHDVCGFNHRGIIPPTSSFLSSNKIHQYPSHLSTSEKNQTLLKGMNTPSVKRQAANGVHGDP